MPHEEGYYAGLINDRACPYPPFTFEAAFWWVGNQHGLTIHCAIVEAIYISEGEHA